MKFINLAVKITQRKKEVYYPIFTILTTFLIYWMIILFTDILNSQLILPFLLSSIAILILRYSLDIYHAFKENSEIISKFLIILLFFIAIAIIFLVILRFMFLIVVDIYYLIPINIHLFITALIYYVLRSEIKKYYIRKEKPITV
ncbi:MAG: hypothetical protein ACFE8M_06155 [Candidatus Hermodarchaeota archaeon]